MTFVGSIAISPTKRRDFRLARVSMSLILPRDANSRHIDRSVPPWVGKPTLWCLIRSGGRLEPKIRETAESTKLGSAGAWFETSMVPRESGTPTIPECPVWLQLWYQLGLRPRRLRCPGSFGRSGPGARGATRSSLTAHHIGMPRGAPDPRGRRPRRANHRIRDR